MDSSALADPGDVRRRGLNLGLCVLVGLASGSNYVYSAYAPQLASRLDLTSTTVNLIGLAGNFGVYSTGPIWGKLVDARGQRLPLILGGISSLSGYTVVRAFLLQYISLRPYLEADIDTPHSHTAPSVLRLVILLVAMFMTGAGGAAGLTAAVNATAKSFSDVTRASATGAVLAGFGLSAFTFSTLGHLFYSGDAAGLLGLLAWGTGLPMLLGSAFIRTLPPRSQPGEHENEYRRIGDDERDHTRSPQVIFESETRASVDHYRASPAQSSTYAAARLSPSIELIRSRSPQTQPHAQPTSSPSFSPSDNISHRIGKHHRRPRLAKMEYTPSELITNPYFLALFAILSLLSGTGLMYINNVGTVALALGREGAREYDKHQVSLLQSRNVGLVSIWNCLGRIIGGVVSDFSKSRLLIPRVWFLPLIAALFILSQLAAMAISSVHSLWLVSTLLGGAYGALFNVMPMLVLEWFGMSHFSQNYGWITVAPVIGGNMFNLIFGRVYDSNTIGRLAHAIQASVLKRAASRADSSGTAADPPMDSTHDCLLGGACYASAFRISALGCCVALGISAALVRGRERRDREMGQAKERAAWTGEGEGEGEVDELDGDDGAEFGRLPR